VSDSLSVVWDEAFLRYRLSDDHPLHPIRLALTVDLARSLGVLDAARVSVLAPEPADDDLLRLVHSAAYLAAVRAAPEDQAGALRFGMGTPDNPIFPRMHESAALLTGASVLAASRVLSGQAEHAANIGGGLHHAMPERASGFCIYNDPAVAIAWMLGQGLERIAYVDVDVHHGDGVQHVFYDDPRVLTISLHQHPMTLFPGTGFPGEVGTGDAQGTAVNLALPPGTDDRGWLRAFHAVVPGVLRAFRPQVLVTQCGCDSHRDDPLADLALTIDGQRASYAALHALAHELCDGRWLLLGGGGYGVLRCVPRAWTHLLAEASGAPVDPATAIPPDWAEAARRRGVRAATLPQRMTEDGDTAYTAWQPGDTDPVGRAVIATRRAVYPLSGLDPDDPRD
jgi:acetoin utilization protein AcuC